MNGWGSDQEESVVNETARILIVDDEPNVRLVFRTALECDGYAVSEACDGGAALAAVHERPFDVVLLDLRMPGTDGMETLRRLACEGVKVPVVVVSAQGSIPDVVAAVRLGAVDFIPKPLAPETLRRAVRLAVVSGRGQPGQAAPPAQTLADEVLARARQAVERGDRDEADFFVRVAVPLGVDPALAGALTQVIDSLRRRRGPGQFRMAGGLTWG